MTHYFDNAATTAVCEEAAIASYKAMTEFYGNPSSLHKMGREAKSIVDNARKQISTALACNPSELIFTSCGSESDNWAILSGAEAMKRKGKHIITTAIEHAAVGATVAGLEKQGFEVTLLPVYDNGVVRVEDVKNAIREDTALVSVMFANNEIGTVQPIAEIGAVCREAGVLFHTDAVQAAGHVNIDVKAMNIDLMSMSAHKMYGPKGIGALYIRKGLKLANLIHGGGQEFGLRAGTENTPAIIGFGKAAELAKTVQLFALVEMAAVNA